MCKKTKFWLLLASCLILCGALLFGGVMFFLKWNFLKLGTVEMQTKTYEVSEAFSSISVDVKNADVAFLPSDTDVCRVVCYEDVKRPHTVEIVQGTLTIGVRDERKWYDHINFGSADPLIRIYLPIEQYDALRVKASTGDVGIPKEFSFASIDVQVSTGDVICNASATGEIKLKASTGDLLLEGASAGSLTLSLTTGHVTVNALVCTGGVVIEGSTGNVNLTDLTCKSLTTSGSTGDLLLKNVIVAGKMTVHRSTGGVRLDACDATELFIRVTTGDVTGTLCSGKTFAVSTTTGHVQHPDTVGGACEIRVTTGDVVLEILQ